MVRFGRSRKDLGNVLGSFWKGFRALGHLLCTDAWVLSDFMILESICVHRRVGFKQFYDLGIDFCAQARVLYAIL